MYIYGLIKKKDDSVQETADRTDKQAWASRSENIHDADDSSVLCHRQGFHSEAQSIRCGIITHLIVERFRGADTEEHLRAGARSNCSTHVRCQERKANLVCRYKS